MYGPGMRRYVIGQTTQFEYAIHLRGNQPGRGKVLQHGQGKHAIHTPRFYRAT